MLYDEHSLKIFIEELAGVILGDSELATDDADADVRNPALDETVHLAELAARLTGGDRHRVTPSRAVNVSVTIASVSSTPTASRINPGSIPIAASPASSSS